MYIRMIFCEISEVTEDTHDIDEIITGNITEEEARIQSENVLNILGISKDDIEEYGIEPYWKIERSYDVNVHCRNCGVPDEEVLLKIADIWNNYGSSILSSWSIPGNKMRFKLTFINFTNN